MGRAPRVDFKDYFYHIINRANARQKIFDSKEDYQLFEKILEDAVEKYDMRIVSYCIMPNHFHLVLYPKHNGDIQLFMQWITLTHTQRIHAKNKTAGYGHIYQGRYKSFLVNSDNYLNILLRYVEQNPLRAKLVKNLKDWRWGSYHRRNYGTQQEKKFLSSNSVEWPSTYMKEINKPFTDGQLKIIRTSVNRGKPLGNDSWVSRIIKKFKLESTDRRRGRPKKGT